MLNIKVQEVLQKLQEFGSESTKKIYMAHGAKEPLFGVKVQDLKKIQKKVKSDYELSLELFDTGNSDAMYLAALIADPGQMSRENLDQWAEHAYWHWLSGYAVAWVASESRFGGELALKWIDSLQENVAATGWGTLTSLVGITPDEKLDKELYIRLLDRVSASIHQEKNEVRRAMNNFVIAVGGFCTHLSAEAFVTAARIGKVSIDVGGTACKVPVALEYIKDLHSKGRAGKKRKSARC
jgi:3-methyladenine DNA glycosylase AlkD